MKIVNNWIDVELANWYKNYFLYGINHSYGHVSNPNAVEFYWALLNEDPTLGFLLTKIKNDFFKNDKTFIVDRCYVNIQHQGMNGDWHTDDDAKITALWMPCETNDQGGQFQIKEEEKTLDIPYVFNQLIFFKSDKKHRGLAFTNFKPRVTLAFKIYTE